MNIEELQEKFEQLASTMDWIKTKLVDLQEEKGLSPVKTPYEVEVPEDIDYYYIADNYGAIYSLDGFSKEFVHSNYQRGLAFKTREEAEQHLKESILLFKMHKWAEEHNGRWTHNLKDLDEGKYIIRYDYEDNQFAYVYSYCHNDFSKLPIFNSEEIAEQFIKEFGEEIKEVLC